MKRNEEVSQKDWADESPLVRSWMTQITLRYSSHTHDGST